jgi:steroid delta-isomerase-like uncharacterized protein
MNTPQSVVEAWAAAYNVRNAVAQGNLYAEDATNFQRALGQKVVGRGDIQDGLAKFYVAFPDSCIQTETLLEVGTQVAWFWVARGTWTGTFAGLQPTGKPYTLSGSTLFMVRDGKIAQQDAYWDRATWFTQLGIPL